MKNMWIAGVHRGHNSGVCLLKDGEVVFNIEEERLSRNKYDGGPLLSILKIKEYTDKLDYLVFSGQYPLGKEPENEKATIEFIGLNAYITFALKLKLIDNFKNQVVDYSSYHHLNHAKSAFYKSGFDSAVAVVSDGSGSRIFINNHECYEQESIFNFNSTNSISTLYKHFGGIIVNKSELDFFNYVKEFNYNGEIIEAQIDKFGGIGKTYEASCEYCGFHGLDAGKIMGLSPYGEPNDKIPKMLKETVQDGETLKFLNPHFATSFFPGTAFIDILCNKYLDVRDGVTDVTTTKQARDLAYAVQQETQQALLELIYKAVNMSGKKKVVLSGGYAMNCMANYFYLDKLNKDGIELFVDPMGNDGGLAYGTAMGHHYSVTNNQSNNKLNNIYLGPTYNYTSHDITKIVEKYNAKIDHNVNNKDVIKLIRSKNIVALYQGRSENGPRALGNRTLLFDPTFEDGKDFVNRVKRREYFRPFAGSILHEHAHEWFDMKGLEESPFMMYAMNCNEGYAEKIPSIIHVDGTCRIQTVKREQNPHYYDLIEEFYNQSDVPIIFNTSFNLGGEPLVETIDDAVRTLANSDIEYLYLPEFEMLITVENGK